LMGGGIWVGCQLAAISSIVPVCGGVVVGAVPVAGGVVPVAGGAVVAEGAGQATTEAKTATSRIQPTTIIVLLPLFTSCLTSLFTHGYNQEYYHSEQKAVHLLSSSSSPSLYYSLTQVLSPEFGDNNTGYVCRLKEPKYSVLMYFRNTKVGCTPSLCYNFGYGGTAGAQFEPKSNG
jgi:hypothetical protein